MENQYNAILGLFIVIVIGCVVSISFAYSQYLPNLIEGQISTHIYSPFNNRGDSIYKHRTTLVLERFFARNIKPRR